MNSQELKAVRLVAAGRVTTSRYTIEDGIVTTASATVEGDHGVYHVTVEPDGSYCDCEYGTNRPGRSHSHTIAVVLAAGQETT